VQGAGTRGFGSEDDPYAAAWDVGRAPQRPSWMPGRTAIAGVAAIMRAQCGNSAASRGELDTMCIPFYQIQRLWNYIPLCGITPK
jgi:hypothetical protein